MTDAGPRDSLSRTEWERRFKARIIERLTARGELAEGWTQEEARHAADSEFDGAGFEYLYENWEEDPEGSADEALS